MPVRRRLRHGDRRSGRRSEDEKGNNRDTGRDNGPASQRCKNKANFIAQLEVLYRMSHGEFTQVPAIHAAVFPRCSRSPAADTDLAENYRDLVGGLFRNSFRRHRKQDERHYENACRVVRDHASADTYRRHLGMNFENMPELHSRYGYYAALVLMGIITIVLLLYFWRRGWIFQKGEPTPEIESPGKS